MCGKILGKYPPGQGRPQKYFEERFTFLDCRGPLKIEFCHFGWEVMVITLSHDPANYDKGVVQRPVIIHKNAWIASRAILYNCEIGEGAVVAIGAVVRSMKVEPYTMVAGNPPVVIKRVINGKWLDIKKWVDDKWVDVRKLVNGKWVEVSLLANTDTFSNDRFLDCDLQLPTPNPSPTK